MSFFTRRRGSAEAPPLDDKAVLVIDQYALPFRSPHWYGHANYHVRVFRPENAPKPVVIMGDLDNDPDVSITNMCPAATAIVANLMLGHPGVHPTRLEDHARWLSYYAAADGGMRERFCEMYDFDVVPGYQPPLVNRKSRALHREEAENLVGGALSRWQQQDYTVVGLQRRGIRVMRVHPASS
ncbi:hypothetical protein [Streptomyces sp. NPDC094472]|uniref:hypothetical protein n=1 Tax=unclassified Streptomyces TaxID=2593676 RepID=UPI00332381CD